MRQGIFITFEGGEGAGKTSLIESIVTFLSVKGISFLRTREPGGTRLGEHIRSLLLQHQEPVSSYAELSLFLASRAQHIFEVIGPALEARKVVLCDRFNDSSIAYQGAARGLGIEKVTQFCDFVCQGVQPHLTLFLDVEPTVGLGRVSRVRGQDRIEAEHLFFHEKIREAYLTILEKEPKRFKRIDATLVPDLVYKEAMKYIEPLLHV